MGGSITSWQGRRDKVLGLPHLVVSLSLITDSEAEFFSFCKQDIQVESGDR